MYRELCRVFESLGIDFSCIAFYNHDKFRSVENKIPDFLVNYGYFVHSMEYGDKYLEHVRKVVPVVTGALHEELKSDGRLGACVDMTQVLSKILEREGVWCVMVEGAFNAVYPKSANITERYLWHFDSIESVHTRSTPGHVWLYCPPYRVVDLTIKYQPYSQQQSDYLPSVVCQESVSQYDATIDDLCSPEVRSYLMKHNFSYDNFLASKNLHVFNAIFNPVCFYCGDVAMRYFPCNFSASDGDLEDIKSLVLNGRYGFEIYNDDIVPSLRGEVEE